MHLMVKVGIALVLKETIFIAVGHYWSWWSQNTPHYNFTVNATSLFLCFCKLLPLVLGWSVRSERGRFQCL